MMGWVLFVGTLNWVIGCFAMTFIDSDERILKWVEKSPLPFAAFMVASFWFVILVNNGLKKLKKLRK